MWPRHRLDIGVGDLAHGLLACLVARRAEPRAAGLLASVGLTGRALVAYSVRSGWELLLGVADWPVGDEVLVSGITHPDMVTLVRAHGLRPVAVDVDPVSLMPSVSDLERARTDRTRAVVVAQLFGGRGDLAPVAAFAAAYGLLLVEDAAQAFTGPESLAPDTADVSLYSFGVIKTATAAGGALVVVRDHGLLERLQRAQQTWPQQGRAAYAGRLIRVAVLSALGHPRVYRAFFRVCTLTGADPDRLVNAATRSFNARPADVDQGLLTRVRHRPAPALVAVLGRRLRNFDGVRLQARARAGEGLAAALPEGLSHPGEGLARRSHWLFPVVTAEPPALVHELRRRGIDASRATSNLSAVGTDEDRTTPQATALLRSVVYLPAYPELPDRVRTELVAGLRAVGRD